MRVKSMESRAFIFTIDALLALTVVTVALASVTALHQQNGMDAGPLEALARSYLVEKYAAGANITTANFTQWTGLEASETVPTGSFVARGSMIAYPGVFAACGCQGGDCGLVAGVNDSCLSAQEDLDGALKEVWVRP